MTEFISQKEIADVILVKPKRFGDSRGYFCESYQKARYDDNGIDCSFVQDNHSLSAEKGIIRGLHFQAPPFAQDKLVRCTRGTILDVAVDIRNGSPTFGKFVTAELSAENGHQLFVPKGFAHGFCTLEENCEVQYKTSDYYSPEHDGGIRFDDPDIGILWPAAASEITVSAKDDALPTLKALGEVFQYNS